MAGAGAGEGARSGVVAQWLAERRFGFGDDERSWRQLQAPG